jgi:hypothetical protein
VDGRAAQALRPFRAIVKAPSRAQRRGECRIDPTFHISQIERAVFQQLLQRTDRPLAESHVIESKLAELFELVPYL